jgi:hypothetical protein
MSSALRNVQLDIASRLRLAPFFWENGVSVLCPLMQDWEDQLEQELARIGRAAVVSIPDATSAAPSSGLFLDGVRVVITCIEDRSRNHANSSFAEEMAEVVACFLQHYRTEALHECLVFTGMADLLPERDDADGGTNDHPRRNYHDDHGRVRRGILLHRQRRPAPQHDRQVVRCRVRKSSGACCRKSSSIRGRSNRIRCNLFDYHLNQKYYGK